MATRDQIQRIRQQTAQAVRSFEDTFKEIDRLVDANAPDDEINNLIRESGIPDDAFVDAYTRYRDSGGVVDFGVGRSLLQGLTFGFADEIEAALPSAVTGLKGDYEQRVGQIRAGQKAFEGREPTTAMVAEMVGALPTLAIPVLGAGRVAQVGARAPSLARTMAAGSGIGAAEGVLGAAGRSESMEDFTGRALVEGGLGAGLGGLAPPLVAGAGRIGRIGRSPETRSLESLSRAIPETEMPRIQAEVESRIARGETGEMVPETLADITGATAQRELRGARGASPEIQAEVDPMMRQRFETQAPRIEREVERGVGVRPEEATDLNSLIQRQERQAADSYENLRQQYQAVDVSDMRGLFNSPAFQRNYNRVIQTMQNRAASGQIDENVLRQLEGKMTYEDFMAAIRRGDQVEVPFDFLERMKRRISSESQVAKRAGDTETAGELGDLARSFTQRIDEKVPEYAQARNLFAGQAEVAEALEEGAGFLRQTPATVQSTLEKLTDSEKRAYLTGAVGALRNSIEGVRDRADLVQRLVGTPANRKRLATLMGGEDSPAFREFENALRREARMVETKNIVTGGSQTAAYLRDIERSGMPIDQAVELLLNPMSATSPSFVGQVFASLVNFVSGPSRGVSERVARRLIETDPRAQLEALRGIQSTRAQAERTARQMQNLGILGAGAAGQIPSLLDAGE
jgi:hypothetical protein